MAAGKKTPAVEWEQYQHHAADVQQLHEWFADGSKLGIGIVTGTVSGLVVLDTDSDDAEQWVRAQGLPETLKVKTSAGWHRYFRLGPGEIVRNSAGLLYPGVDTRGEGGFVVAPPTVHPSGRKYLWAPVHSFADWELKMPEKSYASEIGDVIPEHARNDTLTSIAGTMRRRGMSEAAMFAALMIENEQRCDPPLSEDEVHKISHSVAGYAPEDPPQPKVVEAEPDVVWHIGGDEEIGDEEDEIVHGIIFRGARHLIVSLPKSGKSVLSLAMCGAIRSGKRFLGHPTEPARILYLTEEPVASFGRKLERYGLDEDPGFQYLRRFQSGVSAMAWPDIIALVYARAIEIKAEVVVIDVLHRWAGFQEGQENDSGVVSRAIRALDPFVEANITTIILHHATWAAKRGRGSTDILGSVDMSYFIEGSGADARKLTYQGGRYDTTFIELAYDLDDDMRPRALGKLSLAAASKTSQILGVLTDLGPSTSAAIANELGWNERTARRWTERAYELELIGREVVEHGKFRWRARTSFEYLGEV